VRRRIAAVAVVTAIGLTACTGGGSEPRHSPAHPPGGAPGQTARAAVDDPKNIPDAAALRKVAQGLAADPAVAASALVERMFGDDAKTAVAATGELLRRSGLPLVTGKGGPPVAMPDKIAIVNAPVGVELLPSLTQQARSGIAFDLGQVRAMLAAVGAPESTLTAEQLVAGLAGWGKAAAEPDVSRYAGAAERALAAQHGQLLDPAQVLDGAAAAAVQGKPEKLPLDEYNRLTAAAGVSFDPVQFLLLAAHAASAASDHPTVKQVPSVLARQPNGQHSLVNRDFGTCADIAGDFDGEVPSAVKGHAKATLQEYLKQDIAATAGKEASEKLGEVWGRFDKYTDVLSTIAFVSSLRFDVAPLGKATTHFLHEQSDPHANDVKVRAHAYFKATVPEEYVPCYALAGLGLPTNKDLENIQIIWTLPNGRHALKPAVVGDRQFDHPIKLDSSGLSTVQLTPRRELHPPKKGDDQPVATALQLVKATLDKDWLEAHISDLIPILFAGVAGVPEVLAGVAWNNVLSMIKKLSLPSVTVSIPVTYHGSNVYRILGDGSIFLLMASVGLKADFYSCKGPRGPWQGTLSVSGSAGALLEMAGKAVGIDASGSGTETVRGSFLLNEQAVEPQKFTFGSKYGLVVELDKDAVDKGFKVDANYAKEGSRMRQIGVASWLIADQDVRVVGGMLGALFARGTEIPVEAVDGDLRCPGTAIYQDPFD
jgi:hypothetical protein